MIQVSSEFKKAIKEPEREIKGYVEVLYNLPNITITPTTNINSSYTELDQIANGVRVENLYGSLDYLPLDGSMLTMDTINTGYISDNLFSEMNNPTITLDFEETTLKGITMYFRTNTPTNLTLNYSDGTSQEVNNEEDILQIIFDTPKTLNSISIVINDVMYQDRKLYMMEIDLGVSYVYKDQDLIDFTVDEEVNKLVEEVPINETNVTLNNMYDLFNPLNPSGIVPYLSENTLIKPYIGVLTENKGIEYVKMGEFYFDSYTNNSDATTTLVGKNIIKLMQQEQLKIKNRNYLNDELTLQTLIEYILGSYDSKYTINTIQERNEEYINLAMSQKTNLLDTLKDIVFLETLIFYGDRDNKINIKSIDKSLKEIITKYLLIEDAEFKKIKKINTIEKINYTGGKSQTLSDENAKIYKGDFVLKNEEEIFLIEFNTECNYFNLNTTHTGGTDAYILDANRKYGFLKIIGNIGESVSITITSDIAYQDNYVYEKAQSGEEINSTLKIDYYLFYSDNIYDGDYYLYKHRLFDEAPSYEMKFQYNGDPSLEAGDYISVETPYGYKPLFIQKNSFKFDGGLEGSIEGVE